MSCFLCLSIINSYSGLSITTLHVQHLTLQCVVDEPTLGFRGVSSGGLRGLEHPPKVWHNIQLSSCVTTIVTEKQQLIAKTNNKLTGLALKGSFSSLLGQKQPSLSSSCLQERVNEGRGQCFGGVAKNFARALRARLAQHLPSLNPGHAPGISKDIITHWYNNNAHVQSNYTQALCNDVIAVITEY